MNKQTIILVLLGLAVRLFIIFPGPLESRVNFIANKADLRNYYWPAQAALRGENPYALWQRGQSGEFRADMAPLELLVYLAAVAVWNDPRAIQLLFALFDAANIVLLGWLLSQSRLRLPYQIFYALGPLALYNLTFVPEDKSILLTLTLLLLLFLQKYSNSFSVKHSTLVLVIAALIASFKWLSVFYLLPLLMFISKDFRKFLLHGLLFGAIVFLAHIPWFPSWSYVYAFRSVRVETPIHTSPAVLLNAIGLFSPALLFVLLGLALLWIYLLFWSKGIDIFEAIVLGTAAGILWTPDMDPVHLSVVTLGFLLVVNWATDARMLAVWVLSFFVAAVYAISTHTGFSRFGLTGLQLFTGAYGSVQMILLSYALFLVVFGFYLFDKLSRRPVGQAAMTEMDE